MNTLPECANQCEVALLIQATLLLEQECVESDDQELVLAEVQRYLNYDSSGISNFDCMNPEWKGLVGQMKSGAPLGKNSEDVISAVSCWHRDQRDLCLIMSPKLGQNVGLRLSHAYRADPRHAQRRLRVHEERAALFFLAGNAF